MKLLLKKRKPRLSASFLPPLHPSSVPHRSLNVSSPPSFPFSVLLPGGSVSLPFSDSASERPPPTLSSNCPANGGLFSRGQGVVDSRHLNCLQPFSWQEKERKGGQPSITQVLLQKRESFQNGKYGKNRILESRAVLDFEYLFLCEQLVTFSFLFG